MFWTFINIFEAIYLSTSQFLNFYILLFKQNTKILKNLYIVESQEIIKICNRKYSRGKDLYT
jgi:hypothetical protein